MLVTLLGISMLVRAVLQNAASPMLVTLLGISMLVRRVQFSNAPFPIHVTSFGITVFLQPVISVLLSVSIMALQPSRLSYTGLPSSTTILTISGQVEYLQPVITQYFASNKSEIWS